MPPPRRAAITAFYAFCREVDDVVDETTDAGIAARDTFVASTARARGIPLASAMGGGYGDDIMAVAARHAASMRTCAAAYLGCAPPKFY